MNLVDPYRIIAIVLVKNEDIFIERVLRNILEFCDKIIVADHCSTDGTSDILKNLDKKYEKIEYHLINELSESHDLVESYAGENVWIFAVDGDEIYDPEGLREFRTELLSGKYNDQWLIFGNVLNCVEINTGRSVASGFLAPPCRSMTKLYNFSLIEAWEGSSGERLHGGDVIFKEGFSKSLRYALHEKNNWETAKLRCLHMCFLQRSTKQKELRGTYLPRPNPADILSRTLWQRLVVKCKSLIGIPEKGKTEWKLEKFTRGDKVQKGVEEFFPEEKELTGS